MRNLKQLLGVTDVNLALADVAMLKAKAELELRRRKNKDADMRQQLYVSDVKSNLLAFTQHTYREYEANWHHVLVCKYLDMFARGEIKKLMINMPPQHGKSELASRRLPPYLFGLNPNERIIACSHTADFAGQINREVQRIIDNFAYHQIFPDVCLNRSNVRTNSFGNFIRTSDMFEIVGHTGYYKSAGVGGDITGRSATTLILDDPYKNADEAWSRTIREKIWNWYWSTFMARASSDECRVLIIHTRWHEDDISGRLLNGKGAEKWTVVSLPALAEIDKHDEDPRSVGEVLWPQKQSLESIIDKRSEMGSYLFSALYQQSPRPAEGGIFKEKNFRYYQNTGEYYNLLHNATEFTKYRHQDCNVFATMDLATKLSETSDYTVIIIFALTPKNEIIILNVMRARFEGADHMDLVKKSFYLWKPILMGIEDVQYQTSLVQQSLREGLPIRGLNPGRQDKMMRALPMAAKVEAGTVYLPMNDGENWMATFISELLNFPNGTHDDQVDAFAYINWIITGSRPAPMPTVNRKSTGSRFTQSKKISGF